MTRAEIDYARLALAMDYVDAGHRPTVAWAMADFAVLWMCIRRKL